MTQNPLDRMNKLCNLVCCTPLLKITYSYKGEVRTMYAKAEYYNLSGSIKDRIAYYIMRESYKEGTLKAGDEIVEATSGNTGIAFSAMGAAMGHPVTIYMPNWLSQERINIIKSFGATIKLVSPEEGGFLGSIAMAENDGKTKPNVFLPRQFDNHYNCMAHYTTTGPEIWEQMQKFGATPDIFVAGVGTGGTVMGVGKFLREKNPNVKIHPMEPENSPTLTTGYKVGKHRIQGISDEFIPSIVKLDELDRVIAVDDGDSIILAQQLCKKLGLGVGISSGANFIAGVMLQNENPGKEVVTIFSDDNKKYLSTDYTKEEPLKEGFLSPDIELLGLETVK